MSTVGIITEYNPFHNGHEYHLRAAKELSGAEHAVVVMSGDFVQRGEPAMFDKHLRAKRALENGADMVLLLPAAFSLASAQAFASGGVGILHGTGIVDSLAFGSESGDIESLRRAAYMADNEPPKLKDMIKTNLDSGLCFPDARAKAWQQYLEGENILSLPNDILGIEYIRALNALDSPILPVAVPRIGPGHDSPELTGSIASASAIRERIQSGISTDYIPLLPHGTAADIRSAVKAGTAPRCMSSLSRETVYALRCMTKQQLAQLPDVTEGLENLLYSACRQYSDIDSLLAAVKSRRYTMARLKRICMCTLLGIYGNPMDKLDGLYIRVLGVRKNAMHLLSDMSKKASLPVIVKYSDTESLNEPQMALHQPDMLSAEIAPMAQPNSGAAKFDYSSPLLII